VPKPNQAIESRNMQKILEIDQLNIEEKLFLNRLAFICFKKNRGNLLLNSFTNLARYSQEGKLEKK